MPDVGQRQPPSLDESVARNAWPANFDEHDTDPLRQTQTASNHAGIANLESVRFFPGDLDTGSRNIGFAGQHREGVQQPVFSDGSRQIVGSPQSEVIRQIGASGRAGFLSSLGQRQVPCFVEFAHFNPTITNANADILCADGAGNAS